MKFIDQVCDGNSRLLLMVAIVLFAAQLVTVVAVIAWPLRKSRIDAMAQPFGDQPSLPAERVPS